MKPQPGDKVRLTASFLTATKQTSATRWTVLACPCSLCAGGKHVAVNEPAPADPFGNGTIAWGSSWRHFAFENLERAHDSGETLRPTRIE